MSAAAGEAAGPPDKVQIIMRVLMIVPIVTFVIDIKTPYYHDPQYVFGGAENLKYG